MNPETCKIEYLGFENPKNPNELKLEIAGLEHLISIAKERRAALKQSLLLAEISISDMEKKK
jgi:hypothetical protein